MDQAKAALVEEFVRRSQGQPQNRCGFHSSRTRSEFRFLITRSHDDRFLLQLERYLHRLEAHRAEVKDSSAAVIPVRTSALLCGRRMARQTNSVGLAKLTDKERGRAANAWRLRQFRNEA